MTQYVPIILSCLRMEVRFFFFFVIHIEMTAAYTCVYVCEFRGWNSLKGGRM